MKKAMIKEAMLGCAKHICEEITDIIKSVDVTKKTMDELNELVGDADPISILNNINEIATVAAMRTKLERNPEEMRITEALMKCQIEFVEMIITERIPTLRELSQLLSRLALALSEYEEYYKASNEKGAKMPSEKLYLAMFSLMNTRVIAQCN